jgi:hypothetical protein
MKMIVEKQMECRLTGEAEVLGENLPQRHFCPSQNPTRSDLGLNPGRRGGKPATYRLSYGAAFNTYLLTYLRTELSSSREAANCAVIQKIPSNFKEPEGSSPCSQEPTVRNIPFLSTILELCREIALFRKPLGIGHMYIYIFLPSMTNTMTYENIDLSFWDILYVTRDYVGFPKDSYDVQNKSHLFNL